MVNKNIEDTLWALVREDANGVKYVMRGRLTKSEAEKILADFKARHHQQWYEIKEYNLENRDKLFKDYLEQHLL